jgi:hypothetical protein
METNQNKVASEVQDRAREWVNENHPEAEGAEYDALFNDAVNDLLAIDAHNDSLDAGWQNHLTASEHTLIFGK